MSNKLLTELAKNWHPFLLWNNTVDVTRSLLRHPSERVISSCIRMFKSPTGNVIATSYDIALSDFSMLQPNVLAASGILISDLYMTTSSLFKLSGCWHLLVVARGTMADKGYVTCDSTFNILLVTSTDRNGDKNLYGMINDSVNYHRRQLVYKLRTSIYSRLRGKECPTILNTKQGIWNISMFNVLSLPSNDKNVTVYTTAIENNTDLLHATSTLFENHPLEHYDNGKFSKTLNGFYNDINRRIYSVEDSNLNYYNHDGQPVVIHFYFAPASGRLIMEIVFLPQGIDLINLNEALTK